MCHGGFTAFTPVVRSNEMSPGLRGLTKSRSVPRPQKGLTRCQEVSGGHELYFGIMWCRNVVSCETDWGIMWCHKCGETGVS